MDTTTWSPGHNPRSTYNETCARINETLLRMERLGVKTFNGNSNPNPDRNKFAALDSDEEEKEEKESEMETRIEEGETEEDESGEFTTVVRKRKQDTNTIGPHRVYTEEECKVFSSLYNSWFECLTGENIGFIITPSSQPYVSAFESCMLRDHILATLFDSRPNWVDPMGGSGGDTAAALFNLYPKTALICEYAYTADAEVKSREYEALQNNIENMRRTFDVLNPEKNPDAPIVHMYNKKCEDFLRELDPNFHIDILYLDPNWYKGGALQETERSPSEMVSYLKYHVLRPLEGRKHPPKCIVFKTRWLSQVLWPFMKILTPDYHPMYSIEVTPFRKHVDEKAFQEEGEVRGRFHWAVIVHNELKTIHYEKSEVYRDIFLERRDVFIEKKDVISPIIPTYAGLVPLPKKSKRTSGEGLIHIRPPKRVKRPSTDPVRKGSSMSRFKTRDRR